MSDTEQQDDQQEPKIVVDTDWKEQVAKEKEAAAVADEFEDQGAETVVSEPVSDDDHAVSDGELPPPPPASFEVMISMLFTQAMSFLGQIPDPASGQSKVNKPYAKHYIDTLEMLGEKTEGNLSDDEQKMLSEALHALRMMYVNVKG